MHRTYPSFPQATHTYIHIHIHIYMHTQDIPKLPTGNATGHNAIKLNWKRPFEEYHTGGSPVIGARVLVRPAWHWDWCVRVGVCVCVCVCACVCVV